MKSTNTRNSRLNEILLNFNWFTIQWTFCEHKMFHVINTKPGTLISLKCNLKHSNRQISRENSINLNAICQYVDQCTGSTTQHSGAHSTSIHSTNQLNLLVILVNDINLILIPRIHAIDITETWLKFYWQHESCLQKPIISFDAIYAIYISCFQETFGGGGGKIQSVNRNLNFATIMMMINMASVLYVFRREGLESLHSNETI